MKQYTADRALHYNNTRRVNYVHTDGRTYSYSGYGSKALAVGVPAGTAGRSMKSRTVRTIDRSMNRHSVPMHHSRPVNRLHDHSFKKDILMVMICILLSAGVFFIFHMMHNEASVVYAEEHLSELQYKIVKIHYGDSLWSIAEDNMNPGYHDIKEYIEEIRECNQLSGDQITAGASLMIPYYEIAEDTASAY